MNTNTQTATDAPGNWATTVEATILADLDNLIRLALAAGYLMDAQQLRLTRARVAAEARAAAAATTVCTDCGGSCDRLPVVHQSGAADFYCLRCSEIVTVYPALVARAA